MIAPGRIACNFSAFSKRGMESRWLRLARVLLRHPADAAASVIGVAAIVAIVVNSLYMQPGPHPAPIFAIRPLPVASRDATGTIAQLLRRHAVTAEPARAETVPLPRPRAPQVIAIDQRGDPIADLIKSERQMTMMQRALNEFGYGPIKVSGTFDDKTHLAIEQFERDHNLPVTGQPTSRFRRELANATGRSLD